MLARPRLAIVAAACAVAVVVPVGIASAGTTAPAPTSSTSEPTPSDSGEPSPTSTGDPRTDPAPVPSTSTIPLPSASSRVETAAPRPAPPPTAPPVPDGTGPVEPNDGVAPAIGQVDEFLRMSDLVAQNGQQVADARAALGGARLEVRHASVAAQRASLALSVAGTAARDAAGDTTDIVRALYQQGDEGVANLATVMTLGPDGMLERLYNLRAMRGTATSVIRTAEQAKFDLRAARVARSTAVARLRASVAAYDAASLALHRAKAELVNAEAQLARLGLVAPQVEVGPEGCPTSDVPATLRDGAELIGANALCTKAIKRAATPQAALALTWAFQHLGAAYACGGTGRMLPFRADCSSFVSRAYAEGAGLATASDGWAPSTRNMVPWDGVALDRHYAKVSPAALRPGDLVLYDTCPQGGCPYKHVVMYLGHDAAGSEWMLHTNSCGDVAKVERFWGFPTEGSHTFLVARRVLALPGEKVAVPAHSQGTESTAHPTEARSVRDAIGAIG
ncbi:MAG: NlpC/P60 family protein [Candidatus Nanopelagicales bacterium]